MNKFWPRHWFSRSKKSADKPDQTTADTGNAEVQFNRGLRCANGEGEAQDFVQAAEWYRKAAAQNHCLAQFNLGMMCAAGQGMPTDDVEAVMWFDKAAQQ